MQSTGPSAYHVIANAVSLVVFIGLLALVLIRALKRSEDPARLLFKWTLSALLLGVMAWKVLPLVGAGGYEGAFIGIPASGVCGLVLFIIWRHNIASLFAKPFTSLYDGGDAEIEPQPCYSIAEAKRKKGHYTEAIAEIRKELARFPSDVEGHLMLAAIQAENLNDLSGAELTIQRLCQQPDQPPTRIAAALNALADWHLKLALDRDAAGQDLQMIVDRFPGTELALAAAQRIAHLADVGYLLASHDRRRLPIAETVKDLGLHPRAARPAASNDDDARLAASCVAHLQQHPLDAEVREQLAVIYADHYQRLDLATDQLEQLLAQPAQSPRRIAHGLNLLADLQVRHGADLDTVRRTLERIVERLPNHSSAELARNRIELLKLELKGRTNKQAVKLGSYEQDIGLKRGSPGGRQARS